MSLTDNPFRRELYRCFVGKNSNRLLSDFLEWTEKKSCVISFSSTSPLPFTPSFLLSSKDNYYRFTSGNSPRNVKDPILDLLLITLEK